MGVYGAVHEGAQGCTGMHGGTWVSVTWVMHGEHTEAQPSMELKCDLGVEARHQ